MREADVKETKVRELTEEGAPLVAGREGVPAVGMRLAEDG